MPKIVDKVQKRKEIALSCKDLLLKKGINNITISEIAKEANIGKGTVYEYFSSKEDIVLEIYTHIIKEHEERLKDMAQSDLPTKEKIKNFFFLLFDKEYEDELELYREYIAVSLTNPKDEFKLITQQCKDRILTIVKQIIYDAIDRGELKKEAAYFVEPLYAYHTGLVVDTKLSCIDAKGQFEIFLNMVFLQMEQ